MSIDEPPLSRLLLFTCDLVVSFEIDLLLDVTTSRNAVINIVNVANKEFK